MKHHGLLRHALPPRSCGVVVWWELSRQVLVGHLPIQHRITKQLITLGNLSECHSFLVAGPVELYVGRRSIRVKFSPYVARI